LYRVTKYHTIRMYLVVILILEIHLSSRMVNNSIIIHKVINEKWHYIPKFCSWKWENSMEHIERFYFLKKLLMKYFYIDTLLLFTRFAPKMLLEFKVSKKPIIVYFSNFYHILEWKCLTSSPIITFRGWQSSKVLVNGYLVWFVWKLA